MRSSFRFLFIAVLICSLSGTVNVAQSGETLVRPPAFDWDDWTPPKYVPNWKGVDQELRQPPADLTEPPAEPVRWTAQWEEREGCLIAWPLGWTSTYSAFCEIVDGLQDVGVVYMLYHDEASKSTISNILTSSGVSQDYCEWLNILYNDNWTRDWGPQNIWGEESDNWGIVDNRCLYGQLSNNVNPALEELWGMDYYESPILTEGGNLCTDGMGKVFCTSWCLLEASLVGMSEEELRQAYRDYLNVELTVLPWPNISPHLDMSAKLVDPETWIIGQWPPDDPNTPEMDRMVAILDTMTASTGNPYTIYRVQQPDRLPNGYWRTYTNSYMQNGRVLLAVYGVEGDSAAVEVFQQALPGWEIVPINCIGFDGSGGAIHCSTHGIAWHGDDYLFAGELTAEPVNPPVQIPPGGGTFDLTVTLTNLEPEVVTTEFWLEATSPVGQLYSPLYFAGHLQLDPGQVLVQNFSQSVPPRAPAGTYTYRACAGSLLPRVIACADSFNFDKLGVDESTPHGDWVVSESAAGWLDASVVSLNQLPRDFKIGQNYPNPFNAETVIPLELPQRSHLTVELFNVAGRKLATIYDGVKEAGWPKIRFNAAGLASGVYFYRVTAEGLERGGTYHNVGKMLLLK